MGCVAHAILVEKPEQSVKNPLTNDLNHRYNKSIRFILGKEIVSMEAYFSSVPGVLSLILIILYLYYGFKIIRYNQAVGYWSRVITILFVLGVVACVVAVWRDGLLGADPFFSLGSWQSITFGVMGALALALGIGGRFVKTGDQGRTVFFLLFCVGMGKIVLLEALRIAAL